MARTASWLLLQTLLQGPSDPSARQWARRKKDERGSQASVKLPLIESRRQQVREKTDITVKGNLEAGNRKPCLICSGPWESDSDGAGC